MDDSPLMGVGEGVGHLLRDVDDIMDRQRALSVLLQQLAEVAAFQQFHDEIEDAVGLAEVMDDRDSAVLEGRGDPGLPAEPFPQHGCDTRVGLCAHRLEALDRDPSSQRLVDGPPHLAHAPASDDVEKPIPALDQPGFRHRVLLPPSLHCRPPRHSSMASWLRSLYVEGLVAGPSRPIALKM